MTNSKQISKYQSLNSKTYDLEERTYEFARDVRLFVKTLSSTISNTEDAKQLTRSSGSVAANYIEANEALGKKDFLMKVRTSRREAKESRLWLRLINSTNDLPNSETAELLIQESVELKKILSSIIEKSK